MPRPRFLRNQGNYCAVGTYWFLQGRLGGSRLANFLFSVFQSCIFLPNILITIFHNTTINVKPLSPPTFEKFALHFKTIIFIMLALCVPLFSLVHIVVYCRVHLAPSMGQNAPFLIVGGAIVGRCWCRVGSIRFKISFQKTSNHKRMKP